MLVVQRQTRPYGAAMSDEVLSYGRRISELADADPAHPAVTEVLEDGESITVDRRELDARSNRIARGLRAAGVDASTWVVVRLPNGIDHYATSIAAWKLGARVTPLSTTLPHHEEQQILSVLEPSVTVTATGIGAGARVTSPSLLARGRSEARLPDALAQPGKAICSGGSTGRPKVIVEPLAWGRPGGVLTGPFDAFADRIGMHGGQTQLVPGPLYHNAPFCWSYWGLFLGQHVIVMRKFSASLALELIERARVKLFFAVPTMMLRMVREGMETRELSSVEAMFHGAAACPAWLKRRWLELLGPERVFEIYGGTEATGLTTLDGNEWLGHPGSVGRPLAGEIRILDEARRPRPAGEVGEVFMRLNDPPHFRYAYLNAPPLEVVDGFATLGDFGRLDADGYLYVVDRRVDMIVTGGANVFPAEVEGALSEHPGVRDVVVVGVPDAEWGRRVHAVIEPEDPRNPPAPEELIAFARERVARFKVPKTIDFVRGLPRDDSGKIRRRALAESLADAGSSASD